MNVKMPGNVHVLLDCDRGEYFCALQHEGVGLCCFESKALAESYIPTMGYAEGRFQAEELSSREAAEAVLSHARTPVVTSLILLRTEESKDEWLVVNKF
jgi:hypothetical protein